MRCLLHQVDLLRSLRSAPADRFVNHGQASAVRGVSDRRCVMLRYVALCKASKLYAALTLSSTSASMRAGLFGCVVQFAYSPASTRSIVMHCSTGHTCMHKLHPTHSESMTSK